MKRGPDRVKRSATEKRRILRRWRESGLGSHMFGRQAGIAHSTLNVWKEQERLLRWLAAQLMQALDGGGVEAVMRMLAEHDIKPKKHVLDDHE